jgi:O-antigen/teichoic acid export membrane protein
LSNILRNLFILAIGDLGSKLLGFAAIAYMARILGPDNFGLVSIGLAVLGYMVLLSSPGVHLYGTRSVASGDDKSKHIVISISGLRFFISVLLLAGTAFLFFFVSDRSLVWILVVLFSFSLIPLSISLDWFFQGMERMGTITWSRLILNGVYLLFLFLLVNGEEDALMVPVAFFIGNVTASVFLILTGPGREFFQFHRNIRQAGGFLKIWKSLIRRSHPMGFGSTLAQVAFNFPPLLIGFILGAVSVGFYSAAMRIVFAFMMLDRVMSFVFFPLVSRVWKSDRVRFSDISNQFTRMLLVLTIPVCLLSFTFAPELVSVIYGPEYKEAAEVLRLLVWFFFFTSLNTLYLFGLMAAGLEGRYARIMLWGTLTQVGLMTALISPFGVTGVATGFVVGEAIISILAGREYRNIAKIALFRSFVRPAISGLVMGLFLYFRPLDGFITMLVAASIIYSVLLILIGGVRRDDVALLRQEQ